jgi:acyl-CoA carboxylase epsilon subunit-like protein
MNGLSVRGSATPEEVAAILAVLTRVGRDEPQPDAYARWRAGRQRAVRVPHEAVDRPA